MALLFLVFLSLPVITTSSGSPRTSCLHGINTNSAFYNKVLVDVVQELQWSNVVVVYEDNSVVDTDLLLWALQERGMFYVWAQLDCSGSRDHVLKRLAEVKGRSLLENADLHLVLVGGQTFVAWVMEEMSRPLYSPLSSPTTPSLPQPYPPANWTSNTTTSADWPRRLSPLRTEWLVAVVSPTLDLRPLTSAVQWWDHVVLVNMSQSQPFDLWTLLRTGDTTHWNHVTSLTPTTLTPIRRRLLPNLSQGLSGRTLRVVVKGNNFRLMKTTTQEGVTFQGVLIDMLNELSQRLNFSYILQENHGEWNGLIENLTRKEADLALAFFRLTPQRAWVADPTSIFYFEDAFLVFKTPPSSTNDQGDFFWKPFQPEVWGTVGACALLLVFLLLLTRLCRWSAHAQDSATPDVTRWLMADGEMVLAGLLTKAHTSVTLWPPAGRVLLVTWFYVSSVVLAALYGSQLTVTLAVPDVTLPFSSLEELVDQKEYTWGVSAGNGLSSVLQTSNDAVLKRFYDGVIRFSLRDPEVLSASNEVHLQKVLREERYVSFQGSASVPQQWQARSCCISALPVRGFQKTAVWFLQKNSPYTASFSEALSRMHETGLVTYLMRRWTPARKACQDQDPGTTGGISIGLARTAFYVLGAGLALGALALTAELCFLSVKRRMFATAT